MLTAGRSICIEKVARYSILCRLYKEHNVQEESARQGRSDVIV